MPIPLLIAVAFASLAWLIPDHVLPWTAFYGELAMALALAALYAELLLKRVPLSRWPVLAALMAALAAVPLLQLSLGHIRLLGDGAIASLYIAGFALAIVGGASVATQRWVPSAGDALFGTFVGVGILSVWIQFDQWLSLWQFGMYAASTQGRPAGNLAQPNQMATLLALAFIGGLVLHQKQRIGVFGLTLLTGFLGFGMAMTQSRSVWVELAFVFVCLLALQRRARVRLGRGGWAALGIVLVAMLAIWLPVVDMLLLQDSRTLPGGGRTEAGTRPLHWAAMLDAISRQPWFGYGWNQVAVAQSRVAIDHPATGEQIEHSHSILLDLLVWNGLPLGVLVIGALAWWFWRHLRACRDADVAFALVAIGAVLAHALLEFPLEYAYFLLPVGFLMGWVEGRSSAASFIRVPRYLTHGLALAATLVVSLVTFDYLRAADNLMTLRFESARIGTSRIVSVAPDVVLLTQLREFLRFARTEARVGMSASEIDWMRDMAERFGYPPVLLRYALAAGLNGRPDDARLTLARLCKVHPKRILPEARDNWAALTLAHPVLAAVPFPPIPP